MKILKDTDIRSILNKITKKTLLDAYQPHLLHSMKSVEQNHSIIPQRTVQSSNTASCDSIHLFMPCVGDKEVGLKVLTGGSTNSKKRLGFVGSVVIIDEYDGSLKGVLNAKTLTAFRTALASTLPMAKIIDPYTATTALLPEMTVLGSGLQAFWHAKLCLILYGDRISKVNLINRTAANAEKLQADLQDELQSQFPDIKYEVIEYGSQSEKVSSSLGNSSFILGCMPLTEPVIKQAYLNKDPTYVKYINLIGSYKPHMLELETEFIRSEYASTKIIVDSKEHALHEAGELIQTSRTEKDLVELADICDGYLEKNKDDTVANKNNVIIAKLVGLAIMDVSMGKYILDHSEDYGLEIEDF